MNLYTGKKGQKYFDMRADRRSDFMQQRRASHFQKFIQPSDHVLDFGCGTGGVLAALNCTSKTGIEVNEASVREAQAKNIKVFPALSSIDSDTMDCVISNHAIEHVDTPMSVIKDIARVLKTGGRAVLVVPAESPFEQRFSRWRAQDPDHHLHSWTALSFGNLVQQTGLSVQDCYVRPIGYSKYNRFLYDINKPLFEWSRHLVAFLFRRYEIVCIAQKGDQA